MSVLHEPTGPCAMLDRIDELERRRMKPEPVETVTASRGLTPEEGAAYEEILAERFGPVETVTSTGDIGHEWISIQGAGPARCWGCDAVMSRENEHGACTRRPPRRIRDPRADLLARYSELTEAIEAGCKAKPFDPFAADKLSKQLHTLLGEMAAEGERIRKERRGPQLTCGNCGRKMVFDTYGGQACPVCFIGS